MTIEVCLMCNKQELNFTWIIVMFWFMFGLFRLKNIDGWISKAKIWFASTIFNCSLTTYCGHSDCLINFRKQTLKTWQTMNFVCLITLSEWTRIDLLFWRRFVLSRMPSLQLLFVFALEFLQWTPIIYWRLLSAFRQLNKTTLGLNALQTDDVNRTWPERELSLLSPNQTKI